MTTAQFLDWADATEGRWQLRDGVPEAMAPPSVGHGTIQAELAYRLTAHLRATGRPCRVVIGPGVVPRVRSDCTMLVPDLAVACGPPSDGRALSDPVLLFEVLSPSNEASSCANLWAYTTIPSVQEIVLLASTEIGAELLRRQPDGHWPERPEAIDAQGTLRLDSLDFVLPLRVLYVETRLGGTASRRGDLPDNTGKAWSPELDAALRQAWSDTPSIPDIAVRFQRSRGAIRSRLVRLGLLDPG